ncbi:MAG: hypothetical protein ABSH48_13445 [Verrucomicrobiota bacterium]|jgi:hypothetical protein
MQFKNDPMHVRLINNGEVCHLAEANDQDGSLLLAALLARTGGGAELPVKGLGMARLEVNRFSGCCGLRVQLQGQLAGVAQVVWRQDRLDRGWLAVRLWHGRFTRIFHLSQPPLPLTPPPRVPWMAVFIRPTLMAALNHEQRLKVVALMWGRAYAERGVAGDPSACAKWVQFPIINGRIGPLSSCPDPLSTYLAAVQEASDKKGNENKLIG